MAGTTHLLQSKISPEKMDTATLPLSPTGSCSDEQLPQGFEDLVHHNNATSYPREPVGMEQINVRSPSQSDSKHSTLAPPRTTMSPHVNNQYGLSQHQEPSVYTDNNYAYQAQPMYDGHDGTYPSLPEEVSTVDEKKKEYCFGLHLVASASLHHPRVITLATIGHDQPAKCLGTKDPGCA